MLRKMIDAENVFGARVQDVTRVESGHIFIRDAMPARQPKLYICVPRSTAPSEYCSILPRAARERQSITSFRRRTASCLPGVSSAGSERAALYVMEVPTGREIAGPFADAMWNGNNTSKWGRRPRFLHHTARPE